MQISMAIMPAASLRLLLFSLCGDAMGRSASAMKVRGASQTAFQKVRMKIRGAAQPAAKAKAKVKNRPDAMDIDQSAKGQPFGEDVKERIRRTTRVPSCAKGLKESSSASGSAGASQPDDGDDEEDDVDDGDEEQSLATRTTREKKAAYQVAAEAREARFLKFAMDEARKAEVASRAAEAKRRISEFRASYGCTKPAFPRSRSPRRRDRDAQAAPSARRVVRDVPADGRPSSSGA